MLDNNLQNNETEQQNQESEAKPVAENKPSAAEDIMPENRNAVPKVPEKPKVSEWTEVTGQTLAQLKEKAKITFDQLTPGSKEKDADKK